MKKYPLTAVATLALGGAAGASLLPAIRQPAALPSGLCPFRDRT
jgi:hypothetical protein